MKNTNAYFIGRLRRREAIHNILIRLTIGLTNSLNETKMYKNREENYKESEERAYDLNPRSKR